jgi:hypothetical protein
VSRDDQCGAQAQHRVPGGAQHRAVRRERIVVPVPNEDNGSGDAAVAEGVAVGNDNALLIAA